MVIPPEIFSTHLEEMKISIDKIDIIFPTPNYVSEVIFYQKDIKIASMNLGKVISGGDTLTLSGFNSFVDFKENKKEKPKKDKSKYTIFKSKLWEIIKSIIFIEKEK